MVRHEVCGPRRSGGLARIADGLSHYQVAKYLFNVVPGVVVFDLGDGGRELVTQPL